jgi:hypothetical protein
MLGVAAVDASNLSAVIGVATMAIAAEAVTFAEGDKHIDFSPTAGAIAPGGYLVIITSGLAPAVNVSSVALLTGGKIGDKIALAANGDMGLASSQPNGIVVGKIAGPVDAATNTLPVFIDID